MANSMMRVSGDLVEDLKILKSVKAKGKLGTHSDLVHNLVKTELRNTHVETNDGWLEIGSTVEDSKGEATVVLRLADGMVYFSNNTYVVNGDTTCLNLKVLSKHSGWFS